MTSQPAGSFSVTVPAHRDEGLLEATLASLVTGDESPSDVLLVVGADDTSTRETAERVAGRFPQRVEVVVQEAFPEVVPAEPSCADGRTPRSVRRSAATWWRARALPAARLAEAATRRLWLRVRPATFVGLLVAVVTGAIVTATLQAAALGVLPLVAVVLVLAAVAAADRVRTMNPQRGPGVTTADSFSVTIPAHRDEAVLEATLSRLVTGDYRPSEVVVVVGSGDSRERAAADRVASRHPGLVTVAVEGGLFQLMTDGPARALGPIAARLPQRVVGRLLTVVAAAAVVAAAIGIGSPLYLLYVGSSFVLAAIAWTTLVWMVSAWRTPTALLDSGLSRQALTATHSFSLIVPARHEEVVLEATLTSLMTSDHPAFDVLVVVGDDDPGTREVAERVAEGHHGRLRVVVDSSRPKSKPKALNAALPHCSGAITGVFDAEDDVHPALLQRVDQCFQRTDADVVQAGVQLMNFRSSWLTVRNVLEYYFWFRSRLHFHARQGFIPLGGNTVFIRTEVLRAVSGWDPECLAEDCELGVRLSALGARTEVFYEPELVTREECPPTLGAFAKQRTRWSQGYLQTLSKGYWRRLPLRQRALGAYTLAMPYVMAAVWLTIPIAIATALLVKAPVPITLVSFLPAFPLLSMLAVEIAGLNDFCRAYGQRASARDYIRLVAGALPYQAVLAFAAVRAVARELRGDRGWEKTAHMGLHLAETVGRTQQIHASRYAPAPARCAVIERAPVAVGNGNGHDSGSSGRVEDQFGVVHGTPLWARLGSVSHNGDASPQLPRAGGAKAVAARADLLVLLVLLAGVGLLNATNLLHWPNIQFDEGTYVSYAWAVEHGALAPYTYGYGHPPLVWLIVALWTVMRGVIGDGTYSVDSTRQLMFVMTMVSCSLVFILARRLDMGRVFAAAAVILFGLSPLALYYHRAVLLDNVAIAFALAAFVLALTPRRRLWAFAASGACFAAATLSKETILVLLPALFLAAARNSDQRTRRYCLTLFVSCFGLLAASYPLYAALKGELLPGEGHVSLIGTTVVQLFTREATGSIFDADSQSHAIVTHWLGLDPWLVGAALVLSPMALARRSTRAVAAAFLIQVVMVLRPGYLPNMYVLGLLPFAALIVAGGTEALWRGARSVRFRTVAGSVRVAIVALALLVVSAVALNWAPRLHDATTVRLDVPRREAERWLVNNISRDDRVIIGDEYWVHLVQKGFDHRPVRGGFFSRTLVVYWPLDYDPAVKRLFPGGWRDFDYIVSTEAMRATTEQTPTTRAALEHSHVIARFGQGVDRIEVRAIGGRQPPDRWW